MIILVAMDMVVLVYRLSQPQEMFVIRKSIMLVITEPMCHDLVC